MRGIWATDGKEEEESWIQKENEEEWEISVKIDWFLLCPTPPKIRTEISSGRRS